MISEKKSAMASARRSSSSSSLGRLSVEFDSNPGASGNRTTATGAVNSTGEGSPFNEQPDIIVSSTTLNLLNWPMEERNDLLGAFFIGYLMFQIPGARAAEMFGAKFLFIVTGLGSGLCSLLFPLSAKSSSSIVYAYTIRVIMGATQGSMFPASYALLCEWLPKSERSQWLAIPSSMSRVGTIVMNILVPVIILNYNWEMVFYLSGAVNLVWCLVFMLFVSNSPNQSYWLTKNELIYIESHIEPRVGTLNQQPSCITASGYSINEAAITQRQHPASPQVSWRKMCTNKAILILSLAMFMSEWSNMLLLIKLPGYLGSVLEMELTEENIELDSDKKYTRWFGIIETCEVLKDIEVIQDTSSLNAVADLMKANSLLYTNNNNKNKNEQVPQCLKDNVNKITLLSEQEALELREKIARNIERDSSIRVYEAKRLRLEHQRLPFAPRMWVQEDSLRKQEVRNFERRAKALVADKTSFFTLQRKALFLALKKRFHKLKIQFMNKDESSAVGQIAAFMDRHKVGIRMALAAVGLIVLISVNVG